MKEQVYTAQHEQHEQSEEQEQLTPDKNKVEWYVDQRLRYRLVLIEVNAYVSTRILFSTKQLHNSQRLGTLR